MQNPEDLKYSEKHHWYRPADGAVGITDYAQKKLGTIVYIELPEVGQTVQKGETCGTIESTKAASDLYAPLSGKVVKINEQLQDEPEIVNGSPYDDGWFFVLEPAAAAEIDSLLDDKQYSAIAK